MFTLASGIRTVGYNSSYWNFGITTIAALVLMATIFSMLPFRTKAYEVFLFLHLTTGLDILVGLWYHVVWRITRSSVMRRGSILPSHSGASIGLHDHFEYFSSTGKHGISLHIPRRPRNSSLETSSSRAPSFRHLSGRSQLDSTVSYTSQV